MTASVLIVESERYLSHIFLREKGISINTIKKWISRDVVQTKCFDKKPYIKYSTIPKPTQSRLPSPSDLSAIANKEKHNKTEVHYFNLLTQAYTTDFIKYLPHYRQDSRLTTSRITYCSKLRAVWEKIWECNKGYERGIDEPLFRAFKELFPKHPINKIESFRTKKSMGRKNSDQVVYDTRWFREQHSTVDIRIQHLARTLCSNGLNDTARQIHRKVVAMCKELNLTEPSYSWIKKQVRECERNPEVYASRFGSDKASAKMPYAKIIAALNAGTQWQIDGWDLPFYYQGVYKGKLTSYLKLVLIAVRDSHSRKIVGYSIAESEDTQSILDAIQDAVKNTGYLPHEIVSDNHSFNKTGEAKFFKEALDSVGVTWTVSRDPKRKAIAERYFRHLGELYCKEHAGYIGQGVKSREKSARPSQEYRDAHAKAGTWMSKQEIQLIGIDVVSKFNDAPLKALNQRSPNQAYNESEKPYVIPVELEDRLKLFTRKTELKVTRGQINLTRSGVTYEYQLNSEQIVQLNDKKVIVRYDELNKDLSTIYLYDHKDRAIGSVKQKVGIHGAIADQTPEDIKKLIKNKGRLSGVKSKARKQNEKLRDEVAAIHPDALEALNKITTPKDVLKEVEQDYYLKQRAEELGINLEMVEVSNKPKPLIPVSLQAQERKAKSPFSVRDTHQVKVMDLSDNDETD